MSENADRVILIVDDEPTICWGFERLLTGQGQKVLTASSAEEGLAIASENEIALLVLDVRLPGEDGISALPKFQERMGEAPIVVMTAFGDLETAVAAIRRGACDYLTKPFRLEDASKICEQSLQQFSSHAEPSQLTESGQRVKGNSDASVLVGRSPAMQQVFRQIALVADSELSVLVTGETGTGKELVAAAIHRHSQRSDNPYLAVAPVTFSESVLESELFGHVKGAFTGATEDRKGLFELADGGTVLLDEIGDLPMSAQVKLLRVIEQGEFTAVGDLRPRRCDVRVIAATNRDLHAGVVEGSFREDLLYRLSAVSIHLPPLRQRPQDIPMLGEFFLRRLGYTRAADAISDDLAQTLQQRPWFGNVRELRNAIEHASVIARGRPLSESDFPEPQLRIGSENAIGAQLAPVIESWAREQLSSRSPTSPGNDKQTTEIIDLYDRMLSATEPALFRIALEHTGGNRAAAAQLLGMHRGTLRDRLKRYDASTND